MERNAPAWTLNNPASDLLPFSCVFCSLYKSQTAFIERQTPPQHSPVMRIKVVRPHLPALVCSYLCFQHVVHGDIESTWSISTQKQTNASVLFYRLWFYINAECHSGLLLLSVGLSFGRCLFLPISSVIQNMTAQVWRCHKQLEAELPRDRRLIPTVFLRWGAEWVLKRRVCSLTPSFSPLLSCRLTWRGSNGRGLCGRVLPLHPSSSRWQRRTPSYAASAAAWRPMC